MRKLVDIKESFEGDLIFDSGDFADTGINYGEAANQVIRTILNTKPGENGLWEAMGLDTDAYEGQPNNERNAKQLAKIMKAKIAENSVFYPFEIEIDPFPLGRSTVAFKVVITSIPGEIFRYVVAYDTKNNKVRSLNLNEQPEKSTINITIPPTKNHRA